MSNGDPHGIYEQMNTIRAQMEDTLAKTKRRGNMSGILGLVLVVLTALSLGVAYGAIAKIDAQIMVQNLQGELDGILSEARLAGVLNDSAPDVLRGTEDMIRGIPDELTATMNQSMNELITKEIDQLEARLLPRMQNEITAIAERLKSEKPSVGGQKRLEAVANEIAAIYGEEVVENVDKTYGRYQPELKEMTAYLNKLHKGENLTDKEQVHRDLIITLFAIDKQQKKG